MAGYTAQSGPPVRRVEMEADGIEGQPSPYVRDVQVPDDPTQPYSPNYGRTGMSPADPSAVSKAAYVPADLPADFRRKLVASMPE